MALTTSNNYLHDLISAGNDAHSNLYKLVFSGGVFNDSSVSQSMSIRTSSFTPPDTTLDKYTVKYVTAYVDWPKTEIQVTRNFNIEFRMDQYWSVYQKLQEQKNKTFVPSHAYALTDLDEIKNDLFKVSVYVADEGMKDEQVDLLSKKLYEFDHCFITKIDSPKFTQGTSNSLKVTCTINFLEMYDIESGFPGSSTSASGTPNIRESNRNFSANFVRD